MRITVVGATGMVGSRIVAEAAARGHSVTAVSRSAQSGRRTDPDQRGEITPVRADAIEEAALSSVLSAGAPVAPPDAVVLSIRAVPGDEEKFITATEAVLSASARVGVPLLIVGGAGPLWSPNRQGIRVIDDPDLVPEQWREVAASSVTQLAACEAHPNNGWTYLSPPAILEPGIRSGRYRTGTTTLLTDDIGLSRISAEDLAVAIVDELEAPGLDRHITVAD